MKLTFVEYDRASRVGATIVTGVAALLTATTGTAQDAAAGSDTLEQIVVTAQRREQRLQDVPLAISVTSGESIRQQGIRDLQDLAVYIPSVKLGTNTQSDTLAIRGIGSGLNAGFEQAVGTFVDGLYRGRSRGSRAALFDVERVEVLKGPQTTFFGNNTIAGALNITTRKPGNAFEYNTTALYAPSDGERSLEAGITAPLAPTFSIRAAAKVYQMDGYIKNEATGDDAPQFDNAIGRLSARWEPTDNFRSDLRIDRSRNRDEGQYTLEIVGCPPPQPFTPAGSCAAYIAMHGGGDVDDTINFHADVGPSSFDLDMTEVAWTNTFFIGESTLTAITGYFDQDAAAFIQAQAIDVPATGTGMPSRSPFQNLERYESYSQEIRFESPTGRFFEYMIGAYFSRGELESEAYSAYYGTTTGARGAPETNGNTPISSNRNLYQTDKTRSVFGSVTLNMTDAFAANLGLRYTSVNKTATRSTLIGIGSPKPGPGSITPVSPETEALLGAALGINKEPYADPDTTYDEFLPAASLQYEITPDLNAYVSWAKGFKAGGYADAHTPVQFDSEFVDAYEIGLKGNLLGGAIFFAVDAFLADYSDLQEAYNFISPTTGATLSTIANVAEARAKGIEMNGSWRVNEVLSLNADLAYIDTKYLSYPGGPCTAAQILQLGATCQQDLSGKRRVFSPEFNGTLGATITIPMMREFDLRLSPNIYYSSSYYLQPALDPLLEQDSYYRFDLRAGFGPSDGHWEVALIGKNLNDAEYSTSGTVLGTSPGTIQILPERARSVAISFTLRN